MRFKDLYYSKQYLEESRSRRYMEFFKDYFEYYTQQTGMSSMTLQEAVPEAMRRIIDTLGREDRIMWCLRLLKFNFYLATIVNTIHKEEKDSDKLITLPKYVAHYFYLVYKKDNQQLPLGVLRAVRYTVLEVYSKLLKNLEHYLSLPIQSIIDYRFENQKPKEILEYFQARETEWKEAGGDREIDITKELQNGSIEQLLTFNSGKLGWFNLKKPSCSVEGKAMGHCGNAPRSNTTDTILSLRTIKKSNKFIVAIPHLTFILTDSGELTEAKGRGNDKPATKYHPYIIELLKYKLPDRSYLIKTIKGGGYRPENNFMLSDLSKDNLKELSKTRPDLKSPDNP